MTTVIPVILDMDPGHDDAVALVLACGSPELEVRAVTTVVGNVSLEKTTKNALRVLSRIGRGDVPVGAGADAPLARLLHRAAENVHGESGLGGLEWDELISEPDKRGAIRLMADVVEASVEPVTLIPTGPLTNIENFLKEHPHLKDNVERIVLMGGSVGLGNVTPAAEFNVYVDPEAARMIFRSGVPITMAGLDVGRQATLGPEKVELVRESGPIGEVVSEILTSYARTYERATGSGPPPIYDAVAVAAVVEPKVLTVRSVRVEVECEGEFTRGETVCDLRNVWDRSPNAEVGVDLDEPTFFEVLHRSLKGSAE